MADPLIATSLRWLTRMFVEAGTTGQSMTVEPAAAATCALTLEMAVGRLEEIDQLSESDDRLRRELRISQAEVARLRQRLFLLDPAERSARLCLSAGRDLAAEEGTATIHDLTEALRRERRDAGRPIDGGAA